MNNTIKNTINLFLIERNKLQKEVAIENTVLFGDGSILDSLDVLLIFTEIEGVLSSNNLRCELLNIVYDEKFIGQSITVAGLLDYIKSNAKDI